MIGVKVLMVKLVTAETAVLQAARTAINGIIDEYQLCINPVMLTSCSIRGSNCSLQGGEQSHRTVAAQRAIMSSFGKVLMCLDSARGGLPAYQRLSLMLIGLVPGR